MREPNWLLLEAAAAVQLAAIVNAKDRDVLLECAKRVARSEVEDIEKAKRHKGAHKLKPDYRT